MDYEQLILERCLKPGKSGCPNCGCPDQHAPRGDHRCRTGWQHIFTAKEIAATLREAEAIIVAVEGWFVLAVHRLIV